MWSMKMKKMTKSQEIENIAEEAAAQGQNKLPKVSMPVSG